MKAIIRFVLNTIPRPWLIRMSYIFIRLSAIFYHGNKVECPVCESRFSGFLPYGYGPVRENALCPRCLSLERHRLLWLYLKNKTDFFTLPHRVLHIAPEQCFYARFRKMKNLIYITADLESPLADVKLDVQAMPFTEEEFDIVICNHVLEHVPDDHKAIAEIYRVLKPGGFAILLVPADFSMEKTYEDPAVTDPKERQKHFHQYDHHRLYGKDYPDRLKSHGFKVNEQNYLLELSAQEKERFCLPSMEDMYGYKKV